ncbi:hypothetical protein [Streptomyces sp. LUP30]|uniref:hypothetical protein n=1 Tax=Streptomyces sp. LUP30 TaxID=1890285 RepID=UPI00114CD964|nr:hypothetical protein [Streptomyces sp. LUP30]
MLLHGLTGYAAAEKDTLRQLPTSWPLWSCRDHLRHVADGVEKPLRAFRVRLPSGAAYRTVLDEELAVVPAADAFLRYMRFGLDQAELTTRNVRLKTRS